MKRILLAAFCIAATSTIYANNGETKTTSFPNTYWVIELVGSNYQLSDTPPPGDPCTGNGEPCKITTQQNHDLDMQISPAELNNPSQTTIEDRKVFE